jgi:hypothetical protein
MHYTHMRTILHAHYTPCGLYCIHTILHAHYTACTLYCMCTILHVHYNAYARYSIKYSKLATFYVTGQNGRIHKTFFLRNLRIGLSVTCTINM